MVSKHRDCYVLWLRARRSIPGDGQSKQLAPSGDWMRTMWYWSRAQYVRGLLKVGQLATGLITFRSESVKWHNIEWKVHVVNIHNCFTIRHLVTDDRSNRRHIATVLVDMWSLKSGQEYNRCQQDKGYYGWLNSGQRAWLDIERRGRGLA